MAKLVNKGKGVNKKVKVAIQEVQKDLGKENRLAMIQALIPIALEAVEKALQNEISELAGERYTRGSEISRYGSNPGSIFLGDQKVKLQVPRARNSRTNEESVLSTYSTPQYAQRLDDMVFSRVMHGNEPEELRESRYSCPIDIWNKENFNLPSIYSSLSKTSQAIYG